MVKTGEKFITGKKNISEARVADDDGNFDLKCDEVLDVLRGRDGKGKSKNVLLLLGAFVGCLGNRLGNGRLPGWRRTGQAGKVDTKIGNGGVGVILSSSGNDNLDSKKRIQRGEQRKTMKILAIETSCDETAAAVVENGREVLSNIVASSQEMHKKSGGIIPENAAREQVKSIMPVIREAIEQAEITQDKIDRIAVTIGPGLVGSLLVGVETAKTLSYLWNKPIIPVNHLVGHIYANFVCKAQNPKYESRDFMEPKFPILALVVSGGHTEMVLMKNHGKVKWVGGTRDDAAGECFDKCARILGLPYPGGPSISAAADNFQGSNPNFQHRMLPRPMINDKNFEWSFSGLKTAVLKRIKTQEGTGVKEIEWLAAEVQEAIVAVLVKKSVRAIERYQPKSFLLSGGVAANKRLRDSFEAVFHAQPHYPPLHVPEQLFCTDNAVMVGAAAFFINNPKRWDKITAVPQLAIENLP